MSKKFDRRDKTTTVTQIGKNAVSKKPFPKKMETPVWKHTVSTSIRRGNGPFPTQFALETVCFQSGVSKKIGNGNLETVCFWIFVYGEFDFDFFDFFQRLS